MAAGDGTRGGSAAAPRAVREVRLIYPASRRFSGYLSTHRLPGLVTCHAGLTILAQLLRARGIAARVYDEQLTPLSDALVRGADLVGLSVQTSWARQAYRIADRLRRAGTPVVLGGVHASLQPDEALEHADYLVRGEGEHTLLELIDALEGRVRLEQVAGLSYRDAGGTHHNPDRRVMSTAELDRVPWPRLRLVEGLDDARRHPINRLVHFTMATRGCDQACRYCSVTRLFGRALRHRSVGSVIDELRAELDPERQFLFFMDDSLAVDSEFLKALLTALIDEHLVPRQGWHSQLRADVARDPELLRLMKATNCLFVTCGFESVDDRSLRLLGKGQSRRDVERAVARLREQRIIVNGFFMFGTDSDTPATIAETVRFARRSGCMLAGFMPLTPFPGTPVFEQLDRQGRIFTRDWELYDVQHVVFHPAHMSAYELYWRTMACYPAFYTPDFYLRHGLEAIRHWGAPALMAIGASWPLFKLGYWARELAANLDYLAALRRLGRGEGAPFPDLGARPTAMRDWLSGRAWRARRQATG